MSDENAKCNDQPASERSCPDPAGYAPFVPPFHYRTELRYIADSRGAVMADLRMWPALTGYKIKDQERIGNWIAESLSDCAFADRDGDNLQHNAEMDNGE
jgi:hypothetical protein